MAPFSFNLQSVLNYREQLERRAMAELARVERERTREMQKLRNMTEQLNQQEIRLSELTVGEMGERWLIDNYIKAMRSDIIVCKQRITNWTALVEAARQELLRRSKDKKALEKLKENQKEKHDKEEKYREQKEFDETASIRFKVAY